MIAATIGPGIIVMLADTDAGSIVTAAQSGAQWGYRLLLLQLVLMPIPFVVQELTVRLGLITGRGHGELIRERFGSGWAWLSASTLVLACVGALVSELSGMAGVGLLFGVPAWLTMAVVVVGIAAMVWTGSYWSVERVAVAFGAFELVFLIIAWQADPDPAQLLAGLSHAPFGDHKYLYLLTANIGAVIMPWIVFYQQSAVVEKKLTKRHLKVARWETAVGAVVTQLIMAAVLVATAATIGRSNPDASLDTVQQISDTLVPFLGSTLGRVVFALGMSGAALVASGINLVDLSVGVEVVNALLLPIVLGFLYLLARRALPEAHRLKGPYAGLVTFVMVLTAGLGVYAGLLGLFD